jgi:hypothetical protein
MGNCVACKCSNDEEEEEGDEDPALAEIKKNVIITALDNTKLTVYRLTGSAFCCFIDIIAIYSVPTISSKALAGNQTLIGSAQMAKPTKRI